MMKFFRYRPLLVFVLLIPVPAILQARPGMLMPVQGIHTAAADETARGIALYEQGRNDEAIKILRKAAERYNNLRAWHYLGLALEKKGDAKEARKAHEKAAKLGETLVETQLDGTPHSRESRRLLSEISVELAEAGRSAQRYVELNPGLSRSKHEDWTLRAESLLGFAGMNEADPDGQSVLTARQVDVKAIILSKPNPSYTEEARRNLVKGTVVLRAVLAANGKVVAIFPIKGLPNGLTAQAIRAARQIR